MFSLRIWILLLLLCISRFCTAANDLWILDVRGPIGVATMEYVVSSIELANSDKTPLQPTVIIMQLDTPGGLDNAMHSIIKSILSSKIPIVGYVHPKGARAASAGTYILYATHIAAMSPATNLGAATPVQIGLPQIPSDPDQETSQSDASSAMERVASYYLAIAEAMWPVIEIPAGIEVDFLVQKGMTLQLNQDDIKDQK